MSERKVNLEEILKIQDMAIDLLYLKGAIKMGRKCRSDYQKIIDAMKEACRQTLELAAENAETEKEILPECGVLKSVGVVNKQSILDTINQVE